jgi:hypothetical protein
VITVIRNPLGHKLSDTTVEGTVGDSAGDALVTTTVAHGLSDGDYVYIDSNVGTYNGFRYVDSVAYNTFKLKESENGDYIPFKRVAEIEYQVSVLQHGVQCVHLPIVYELESSIYPNNTEEEEYTPTIVDSFEDNNGSVQLNLSSALTDPTRYSKIELVGAGDLAGVYQITQVLQPWSVVIDLDYDASYSFSGYVVVRFYDNYAINVNIYGGIISGHPWESEKPVELLATLKLVPDDNNKVLFSINEYLRSQIKTINDLTIDTFPNNLHFMTEFYIGYFESYDQSDGDEIETISGVEEVDSFVGQAINAKNEFKNLYSGHLSEFVSEEDYPAAWLTDFAEPIAIVGYYFDISFLLMLNGVDVVITTNKVAGEVVTQEITTIENPGKGVIRVEVTPETGYDYYCIQASTAGVPASSVPIVLPDLDDWTSLSGTGTEAWTPGVNPTVNIPGAGFPGVTAEYIAGAYAFVEDTQYTITVNYDFVVNSGTQNPRTARLSILDSSNVVLATATTTDSVSSGSYSIEITFTATADAVKVGFRYSSGRDVDVTVTSVSGLEVVEAIPAQDLTEEICIHILEECDSTITGDLRELESGPYRLLE